jgi:hypothetical protein
LASLIRYLEFVKKSIFWYELVITSGSMELSLPLLEEFPGPTLFVMGPSKEPRQAKLKATNARL